MTPAEERLAEALAIERIHTDTAPVHIAERIGALTNQGDTEGVERWKQIAAAYQSLRGGTVQ